MGSGEMGSGKQGQEPTFGLDLTDIPSLVLGEPG